MRRLVVAWLIALAVSVGPGPATAGGAVIGPSLNLCRQVSHHRLTDQQVRYRCEAPARAEIWRVGRGGGRFESYARWSTPAG